VQFFAEPLSEQHDASGFDSGKPDLDRWLRDHALTVEAKRVGRTFVWADGERTVAYYTIAAHVLFREDLPRAVARGNPAQIPAALLAKLALDRSLHGQGLGSVLLVDALARIVAATRTLAARYVVVDAIDSGAAEFYEHHGFVRLPDSMRLVRKLADIAATLR
jgi:GNAT superfamily N-acetyltransferase